VKGWIGEEAKGHIAMALDAQEIHRQLYDSYVTEKERYQQLHKLSGQQFDLLCEGRREEATEIVQEKRQIIDEIGEIEKRMEPIKQQWEKVRNDLSPEVEQPLLDLVDELKGLIQSILDQDGESEVFLKQIAGETADRMNELRQGRQAARAYQSQNLQEGSTADPCLFDRKE